MMTFNNWHKVMSSRKFIASFSGGKDSVLALYKAQQIGKALGLLIMLEESGQRSRSHAMPPEIIEAQAASIGLTIYTCATSWGDYEENFVQQLLQAKSAGAEVLVTGDLDVAGNDSWHAKVTARAGLDLSMPLWTMGHRAAVLEFIRLGFVTIITTVNTSLGMTEADLGRELTIDFVDELEARNIDPCGEGGEFHTTVLDGPLFSTPITVQRHDIILDGDYAFLPLTLHK